MSIEEQADAVRWRTWDQSVGILEILREMVECRPDADSWNVGKQKRLIRLAVLLDVMPNKCPTCHGVKERQVGGLVVTCSTCLGSGDRPVTQEMAAAYLGIESRSYQRTWQARMHWLLEILSAWDRVVHVTLRQQLRDAT